jgi:hypothetical protein
MNGGYIKRQEPFKVIFALTNPPRKMVLQKFLRMRQEKIYTLC